MPQDERDVLIVAEIGEPVPGEDTFYGNDDVFTIWSDRFEKDVGVCLDVPMQENFAFWVEDAEVHGLGMKIDTV